MVEIAGLFWPGRSADSDPGAGASRQQGTLPVGWRHSWRKETKTCSVSAFAIMS